ncbi:hypothetical protein H3C70_02470 [Patescibacteria group bacterium]|nr:hypothetical protein [Patescibacteria group bacterium]
MSEHNRYRAIGYQTEKVDGGTRHKVWIHGTLPPFETAGAEKVIYHSEEQTLSQEKETEIWFLNYVPMWILLPALATAS